MVPSFPKEMWKLEFWTTGLVQISTKKFVGRGEQQQTLYHFQNTQPSGLSLDLSLIFCSLSIALLPGPNGVTLSVK